MIKFIQTRGISKKLRKYKQEAIIIDHMAEQMRGADDGIIIRNFNSLYGRTDRESLHLGFAAIVEMSERSIGLRPYPVQIMGALAMNDGMIAEMATGEGKTLTAALPLAWNGMQKGAHAMTVNDYLAKRDADLLDPLYSALGLTVNYIQNEMSHEVRQLSYQSNIVYGTPSQFVFDYLRDHVTFSVDGLLQQGRHFVMVDEADSIFIDEARTPLVLSGEGELNKELWSTLYGITKDLTFQNIGQDPRTQLEKIIISAEDVTAHVGVNRAEHVAALSENGTDLVEDRLMEEGIIGHPKELWQTGKAHIWRMVSACVKARHLFELDRDYLVRDDKIVIIDQETGRLAPGRRWGEGIHQAIEAKENVTVKPESKDLGRIALSNYLSLYNRISGMTGTAMTEAEEIQDLYGVSVIPIPTHKPCIRKSMPDVVFMKQTPKLMQIVNDVKDISSTGQPILIGTSSVSESEKLSGIFSENGIKHRVLNARQDAEEALIIAQAGRLGAITIATSMAGRGTDILLGGNREIILNYDEETLKELGISVPDDDEKEKVIRAGGLFVIGCERLDSPRLDLQLAGRSGRQGDPGVSRFYVSLDDPLMKDFGGEVMSAMFIRMGIGENDGLEHSTIDKAIKNAQRKKQSLYIESRKQGLKQDSIIDQPRTAFFSIRNSTLYTEIENIQDLLNEKIKESLAHLIGIHLSNCVGFEEQWDVLGLKEKISDWGLSPEWFQRIYDEFAEKGYSINHLKSELYNWISFDIDARSRQLGADSTQIIQQCMLMGIDRQWQIFLDESEQIRSGIHLRAYAQEKPDIVFRREIFKLFSALFNDLPVVMMDYAYGMITEKEKEIDEQYEPAFDEDNLAV